MLVTLSVKPSAPRGEAWGVSFGVWNDPDQIVLQGFATAHDAWVFVVAHTMEDPTIDQKAHGMSREWTYNQPAEKITQIDMFREYI